MKVLFLFITNFIISSYCYKPVVLLHGILTGATTMEVIKGRIEKVRIALRIFLSIT